MATSILSRTRRAKLALAIALGLTILAALVGPLLDDELTNLFSGTNEILIAESDNSGG
jgi:hypothetical protein